MIQSLELKDFKCFESFDKPILFSRVNLLTGCNGRGKSSIFQSLLLLAQSFRSGKNIEKLCFNGKNVKLGTYYDVLRKNASSQQFSIGFTSDDIDENSVLFVFKPNDSEPYLADLLSLKVKFSEENEKDLVISVGGNDSNSDETSVTTATSAIKAINQLRNVFFISADRQGPQNYVSREDDRTDNIGIHGEYVIHTINEKEHEILPAVIDEISKIMGGASISVKDIDTAYLKILLDSIDGQEGFKPVNVGFGYSYILPIIVLPLVVDEGAKIFIENPEAHLHPGAQSRLVDYLVTIAQKKNLQLFIETHSDHVINELRISVKQHRDGLTENDAKIIHVDRAHDKDKSLIYQINIDREGNLSEYPNGFMEEWGLQMMNLV